ncbi:dispanin subfamily A member 2b-like [Crotalus tigris]|uniref:dispanin subfamily A member 2b-like n=1 Tax=Crotalus tigris TaxID=88082 RepID=UPI00192F46E1|nr:dispanin subfamily A member 2b-like [Crotalus tigris]
MEPRPTEVVTRPSSPYQYPKAILNPAVKDYVVWSLFSFTSCNCCCLGLFALLFSIKSRDRKVLGDPEGAANHGRTAKYLNIAAVIITIIIYIIIIIILISSALFIVNIVFEIMRLPDEIEEFRGN